MKLCILVSSICLLLILYDGRINGQPALEEEFDNMKIHCNPIFTCKSVGRRIGTKPCSCSESCSMYDTCCPSSNARKQKNPIKASCRKQMSSIPIFSCSFYFMVDGCPNGEKTTSVWEKLCSDDKDAYYDVMKVVPVTSRITSITYKNYFCFRCHEATEDFVYWNVKLNDLYSRRKGPEREMKYDRLRYNNRSGTWRARHEGRESWSRVHWKVDIPEEISALVVECIPDLIANCSPFWRDDYVSSKCRSYEYVTTVKKYFRILKYRNPHCAVCNFENLSKSTCRELFEVGGYKDCISETWGGVGIAIDLWDPNGLEGNHRKDLFSFTHLLDIDLSDGDKVGTKPKCKENYLWDPFTGICRKRVCLLPGDVIKGGKCVPK